MSVTFQSWLPWDNSTYYLKFSAVLLSAGRYYLSTLPLFSPPFFTCCDPAEGQVHSHSASGRWGSQSVIVPFSLFPALTDPALVTVTEAMEWQRGWVRPWWLAWALEPRLALPAGWLWVSYSPSCCQSCLLCKHSRDCSSQTSQGRSCIKWVVSAQCWGPCPGHGEAPCGCPLCERASFILWCRSFFHLLISPNRVCLSLSRCLIDSDFSFLVPHGTVMHLISDIVIQWRDTVLLFSVQ